MSLAFNICLCHDLVRTMKDPFSPGSRRVKFYIIFAFLFASNLAYLSKRDLIGNLKVL